MGIPNAYCKKHDEIEPEDNAEFWICPKCSKENVKKRNKRLSCERHPLDVMLEKITKTMKESKEAPFWTFPIKDKK